MLSSQQHPFNSTKSPTKQDSDDDLNSSSIESDDKQMNDDSSINASSKGGRGRSRGSRTPRTTIRGREKGQTKLNF